MKPKVLIIDDEEGIRSSLKMTLEYKDYEVLLAANGDAGSRSPSARIPTSSSGLKMPQWTAGRS